MPAALVCSDGSGSAPTLRDIDGSANEFVYTNNRIAFSGSYTTAAGGETVDLTPLVAAGVPSNLLPINAFVEGNGLGTSQSAGGGYYQFGIGAALNACKLKIFAAGGAELGSGAYASTNVAVLNDVVNLTVVWRKFQ
jgi:hypothetical protein